MSTDQMQATATEEIKDYQKLFSARSIKNYIAAALAAFGYQGLGYVLFSTYLTIVYTEYLGVGAAAIASVMSIGIIVDGITDLLMGVVVDRVRTKWGKAKHWFLITAIPLAVSIGLMWMVPESASQTAKLVYAFIMYNVFCTFCTMVRIPAAALGSLMTDNSRVRAYIGWAIGAATAVASSVTGWIITPVTRAFGENLTGYRALAWIMAAGTAVLLLIAGVLMQEQRTGDDWKELDRQYMKEQKKEKRETIGEQFQHIFQNKWWVTLIGISLFNSLSMGFNFGCLSYFLMFVVGDMAWIGPFFTVLSIPNLIGTFVGLPVSTFLEAKKMMMLTAIIGALATIGMWIAGAGNMNILLVCLGVKAFVSGVAAPANTVLQTRVVDYGEWKNGVRQEGLSGSGIAVLMKIASAIATATLGFVIARLGYVGGEAMPQAAVNGVNFMFLGIPCIMACITACLWSLFKLDEKTNRQQLAEIAARKAAMQE